MTILRLHQIGKAYKQYPNRWSRLLEWGIPLQKSRHELKWILHDIEFEAQAGEAIGILGSNGAGKSTLLKLINGTSTPSTGQIEIQGQVAAILELGMGFHPDFTGRQNIIMAGQLLGLTSRELKSSMKDIVDFAELDDYLDKPLRIYSSGMSMRLAFAVATAKRPDILIIDEALSVGDGYFQHKSFAKIRQFQKQGTTLLLVSHDLGAIRGICNRAIWLEEGTIALQGNTKEVVDAYGASLYGKKPKAAHVSIETSEPQVEIARQPVTWKRDARQDFINMSNLRNDIQVFDFNPSADRYGDGAAKIISITLTDINDTPLSWMVGGEEVILTIQCQAFRSLENIVVGFQVRDRLGQMLFGDNTFLTTIDNPVAATANQMLTARFRFLMPLLPQGCYSVTTAIVVGNQHDHIINDWINQALLFNSNNGLGINGMVGIPMQEVALVANDQHMETSTLLT